MLSPPSVRDPATERKPRRNGVAAKSEAVCLELSDIFSNVVFSISALARSAPQYHLRRPRSRSVTHAPPSLPCRGGSPTQRPQKTRSVLLFAPYAICSGDIATLHFLPTNSEARKETAASRPLRGRHAALYKKLRQDLVDVLRMPPRRGKTVWEMAFYLSGLIQSTRSKQVAFL